MNSSSSVSDAAFDLHSLDTLKRTVKTGAPDGIQTVAKQMEGLFIQMMLKSMRDASFKDGLFDSQQTEMFTSMYDQQIAQNIAGQNRMGLAEMMVKQMGGRMEAGEVIQKGTPAPYSLQSAKSDVMQSSASQVLTRPLRNLQEGSKNDNFITRLMAPAIDVARKTGIPHQLIIAQAALESGWGNNEIRTPAGKQSYNLFGIKATPDWKGEKTEITTTEYDNGVPQKIKATFRVYHSYSEALSDYAMLLTSNHRYRNVINSSTPEGAAKILQSGGYATDPDYAKKIINIIHKLKSEVNQAVESYQADFHSLF